jgi:hypothetical protein
VTNKKPMDCCEQREKLFKYTLAPSLQVSDAWARSQENLDLMMKGAQTGPLYGRM